MRRLNAEALLNDACLVGVATSILNSLVHYQVVLSKRSKTGTKSWSHFSARRAVMNACCEADWQPTRRDNMDIM